MGQLGAFSTGALEYNGVNIEFTEILGYSHESVYDGPQFIYTKHFIHVRGVVSTTFTNYVADLAADANVNEDNLLDNFKALGRLEFDADEPLERVKGLTEAPFVKNNPLLNTWAPESLREIQEVLSIPRKPLFVRFSKIQDGDTLYLESPKIDPNDANKRLPCDAYGGPYPEVIDIVALHGHKTFLVEFKIETAVHDRDTLYPFSADASSSGISAILSNNFKMSHDIDMHFLTVRTTEGACVIDRGAAEQAELSVDDLREIVLPPLPAHFRRDNVHIEVSPDGTTLGYVVVDRQVLLQPYDELTKVELVQNIGEDILSVQEALTNANFFGTNLAGAIGIGRLAEGAIRRSISDAADFLPFGLGKGVARLATLPIDISNKILDVAVKGISKGSVPAIAHGFTLNLYGIGQASTRIPEVLYDKANAFLIKFATNANLTFKGIAGNFTRTVNYDHAGSHLQMQVQWMGSPLFANRPDDFSSDVPGTPISIRDRNTDDIRKLLLAMHTASKQELGAEPNEAGSKDANIVASKQRFSNNMSVGKNNQVIQPPRLKRGQAATFVYPDDRARRNLF